MNGGIVIRQDNPVARSRAARLGLGVSVTQDWTLRWPANLFIAAGTCVPWDLVGAGMNFVARWDVAAPFWKAGVLAAELGTAGEREQTQRVIYDLRVPVYAHELLFVRASEAGQAFISAWRAECAQRDERLAFLRALYAVKPLFCALPRLWLADLAQREMSDRLARQRRPAQAEPLIKVEVAPGRFVRCHERDRATVLERYGHLTGGRRARR